MRNDFRCQCNFDHKILGLNIFYTKLHSGNCVKVSVLLTSAKSESINEASLTIRSLK
jgi:hypothetical protein